MSVPRLRMFAGPNGSGKSTIKSVVPEDKIVSRYARSLNLLMEAVKHTNRAYLFDNSRQGTDRLWVAEITDARELELKCDPMPRWFQKTVWEKINPPA